MNIAYSIVITILALALAALTVWWIHERSESFCGGWGWGGVLQPQAGALVGAVRPKAPEPLSPDDRLEAAV